MWFSYPPVINKSLHVVVHSTFVDFDSSNAFIFRGICSHKTPKSVHAWDLEPCVITHYYNYIVAINVYSAPHSARKSEPFQVLEMGVFRGSFTGTTHLPKSMF